MGVFQCDSLLRCLCLRHPLMTDKDFPIVCLPAIECLARGITFDIFLLPAGNCGCFFCIFFCCYIQRFLCKQKSLCTVPSIETNDGVCSWILGIRSLSLMFYQSWRFFLYFHFTEIRRIFSIYFSLNTSGFSICFSLKAGFLLVFLWDSAAFFLYLTVVT